MKISYSWLKQYVGTELPVEEVARMLTACGLEVEGTEVYQTVKGGLAGLVIGEVLTCIRHPNADKLSLTTVNVGTGDPLQIVCGAPNVAAGQKVIVATVGTTVHPLKGEPFEIKKSKIRGELSEGMICAEDEIGMGESHAGILVLPADVKVGSTAKEYFKVEDDVIMEIGLTPNRVDAASHIGTARDLAALLSLQAVDEKPIRLTIPAVEPFTRDKQGRTVNVEVADSTGCPRYAGITIEDVKVGPSPDWLQHRLKSIGVGPINNVVDITNFVLHECGQPLHAFDADKILGGKVIVRRARQGEKFVTLDGVDRELTADDLMICNTERPMCIAGVFGGIESGITSSTTTVFLESAYFQPGSIRKTGKHHGLKTDASFRYERGADPEIVPFALKRAANLIREIAGGKVSSDIVDLYPQPVLPLEIDVHFQEVNRFIGCSIPSNRVLAILNGLGMEVISADEKMCRVKVPTSKVDVTRVVDVIEEILRIHGYDAVPLPMKLSASLPVMDTGASDLREKVADYLASNGFNELLTNSLVSLDHSDDPSVEAVSLLNPLSQDLGALRTTLLHSGLEAMQYNRNRKQENLRFFEFGKCYSKTATGFSEANRLSVFLAGDVNDLHWKSASVSVDFYLMKSFVEGVLQRCGIQEWTVSAIPATDGRLSAGQEIVVKGKILVRFGSIRKSVARRFDLSSTVLFADFAWDVLQSLVSKRTTRIREIPRFPHVRRDLSMVIDSSLEFDRIEKLAYSTERKLLREVVLFDVYEGEKMAAGKKSYAVSFILEDEQQTLTDQQIEKTMSRLMQAFEKDLGASIRTA